MAFPVWSARLSLWFSAAVHWRLANDQLFRLCHSKRNRIIFSGVLRSRFQLVATGLVWRARDHAVASDQRRKGANSPKRASAGGSLISSFVRHMKLKRILKWSARVIWVR